MANSGDIEVVSKFQDMGISTRTNMLSRQVANVLDSNGSAYNGQIIIDCGALGVSNQWINYNEGYLEIPYVVSAKGDADFSGSGKITKNSLCLKDGACHQIIDSIAVEINQKTVVQVQNFTNIHTQFKLLTTSSVENYVKNRATNGVYVDSVETITYTDSNNIVGVGYINNQDTNTALQLRKKEMMPLDITATPIPTINESEGINSGRSYYTKTGTGADTIYTWVFMLSVKLSDITDVFAKLPLCKTTDVRLIITYNSVQFTVSCLAGPVYGFTNYQQISGHSNPIIITPNSLNTVGNLTVRSNIMKSGLGDTPTTAITSCRLYVPIYKVSDSISLSMIQAFPTTKIEYNDIYNYVVPSITANQSFSHTLTTGIVNPQYLVVIPFPKVNSIMGVADYQSAYSSAPGTTSGIIIKDFQVQLAGLNVFQLNQRYDFEQFLHEMSKINAVFGNNNSSLTSGLINYFHFQQGYRFYVCDLSRRENSGDTITKSIVITGQNTMASEIELICFVAYKKDLSIDTATGLVKE